MDLFQDWCDNQVHLFMQICGEINFPVSLEKTEWGSQILVFLGIVLNAILACLIIPQDKVSKAVGGLERIVESKKVRVRELQQLTGLLNFLCKAIFPGRAFTRRMYAKYHALQQHHHVRVDRELRFDCLVWLQFLNNQTRVARPFVDLKDKLKADSFLFTTDASLNARFGVGGFIALTQIWGKREFLEKFKYEHYANRWFQAVWEPNFIKVSNASIEVCELMAVVTAVVIFSKYLQNRRIVVWCDNQAVMHMLNNATSSCKKCMYLLRIITATQLQHNVRYFARYIDTKANILSNLLSRNRVERFKRLAPKPTADTGERLPQVLWPIPHYLWGKS